MGPATDCHHNTASLDSSSSSRSRTRTRTRMRGCAPLPAHAIPCLLPPPPRLYMTPRSHPFPPLLHNPPRPPPPAAPPPLPPTATHNLTYNLRPTTYPPSSQEPRDKRLRNPPTHQEPRGKRIRKPRKIPSARGKAKSKRQREARRPETGRHSRPHIRTRRKHKIKYPDSHFTMK